jgi:hypothetical protein
MKQSNGIALVVTLMIALLLFIAIVTISSSLSLSGKRVTTDQKVTLEAQYAAESGLALAATQLSTTGQEIETFINDTSDLKLPAGTKFINLKPYLEKFCGKSLTGVIPTPGSAICEADLEALNWDSPDETPFKILTDPDHIDHAKYPAGTTPFDYWRARLGPQNASRTLKVNGGVRTEYAVTYGFVPDRAELLLDGTVRLVWKAMPAVSVGRLVKGGEERGMRKVEQSFAGTLHLDLLPPSFARYMMFTNYQRAGPSPRAPKVYFFSGTYFDGPVHTNDKFNFIGKPWFGDSVTSTGCEREGRDADNKPICLDARPGYYYWNNGTGTDVRVVPPVDPIPTAWAQPEFSVPPKWDEDYIPLPTTSENQYQAALTGGIFIEDPDQKIWETDDEAIGNTNIEAVTLSVATVGGVKYQFVQVHGLRNTGTEEKPGRCVEPGGGGDDDDNPEPPPPGGPPVWQPQPGHGALVAALSRLLNAAGALAGPPALAQPDPCPPGQVWKPPVTVAKIERFSYAYRIDASGRVEVNTGSGWRPYRDHFNGVIYVGKTEDGKGVTSNFVLQGAGIAEPTTAMKWWEAHWPREWVASPSDCPYAVTREGSDYECIQPSIADFTQLTVVGNNVTLTRDLTYEERPCTSAPERQPDGSVTPGDCPNTDAKNVLGIYSDKGSIRISRWAPENLHIDGVLMSAKQRVYYEHWNKGDTKGYLHLTGGIIQNWYGRFGQLDGDLNLQHGYGRKFVYDRRMKEGLSPPYFPKFDGAVPWEGKATYEGPAGGSGPGFWKPVKGK